MSFKIAFIGAGSIVFTRELIKDILSVSEFDDLEIALMDVNSDYLELIVKVIEKDIIANGLSHVNITATTDRRVALRDAKYIFNVVRIGGLETYTSDIMIPLQYGIDQCVGDTICAGGIMYGQRNIPFILDLCADIKEVSCKDALLLNYANPMAINVWAANTYGKVKTIGLCHGVQQGEVQIAEVLGMHKDELHFVCAGINHQAWFIEVQHDGEDLTGRLLEAFKRHPVYSEEEKVRIDILMRFGYYCTESNGHFSEYVPWYRKRPEEKANWINLGNWIHGETGGYLRFCLERRDWFRKDSLKFKNSPALEFSNDNRSIEHGSYIIEALETGRKYRGHFNIINNGTISNLPRDSCVEVPVLVDTKGLTVPLIGELPLGPAAICNTSISVQRLAVEAGVRGNDYILRQAMLLDPLVGAVCNPPEVWQLVDEMLVAQKQYLPQYKKAITEAENRLKTNEKLPYTRNIYFPKQHRIMKNLQMDERRVFTPMLSKSTINNEKLQ